MPGFNINQCNVSFFVVKTIHIPPFRHILGSPAEKDGRPGGARHITRPVLYSKTLERKKSFSIFGYGNKIPNTRCFQTEYIVNIQGPIHT